MASADVSPLGDEADLIGATVARLRAYEGPVTECATYAADWLEGNRMGQRRRVAEQRGNRPAAPRGRTFSYTRLPTSRRRSGSSWDRAPPRARPWADPASLPFALGILRDYSLVDGDVRRIADQPNDRRWLDGDLLAAAIDRDDDVGRAVLGTLLDTCRGTHPSATVTAAALQALACAGAPDGWEMLCSMLLAAQRQEGLRSEILEAAANGNRSCLSVVLRTVAEHGLTRFSSVTAMVDGLLGLQWSSYEGRHQARLDETLRMFAALIEDRDAAERAARQGSSTASSPHDLHAALTALARHDPHSAAMCATAHLADADPLYRYVGVLQLDRLGMAVPELTDVLGDPDLRCAAIAFRWFASRRFQGTRAGDQLAFEDRAHEGLAELLERTPRERASLPRCGSGRPRRCIRTRSPTRCSGGPARAPWMTC